MTVADDRGTNRVASFPVSLALPTTPTSQLDDAATAIKQEYRISVCKKRLRCLDWEHVTEREDGSIYSVNDHAQRAWLWPAPQSGALDVGKAPLGPYLSSERLAAAVCVASG